MALDVVSPIALAVPSWVWATLIMTAFVALSVIVVWLVRLPLDRTRSGSSPSTADDDES